MPEPRSADEEVGDEEFPTSGPVEELAAAREAFSLEPDGVAVYLLQQRRA